MLGAAPLQSVQEGGIRCRGCEVGQCSVELGGMHPGREEKHTGREDLGVRASMISKSVSIRYEGSQTYAVRD